MGSPMGPSIAKLFMYALEKKFLDDYPPQFKPIMYRRYVDNTFCLFKNEDHVDPFLDHIVVVEAEKQDSVLFELYFNKQRKMHIKHSTNFLSFLPTLTTPHNNWPQIVESLIKRTTRFYYNCACQNDVPNTRVFYDITTHTNYCNSSIKLTAEKEVNNSLPFLDILIQKDANNSPLAFVGNQHLLVCM